MRLRALKHGLHSSNPPMGLVETAVWTQIGLHFSIVACTSFCLKPFMAAVSTNYGVASGTQSGDTSRDPNGYAKKSGYALDKSGHAGGSFALKSFGSKTATRLRSFVGSDDDEERDGMRVGGSMFRGDGVKNQAMVTKARRAGSSSIGSSGSTKMIIKKDVAYTVQYGPRGDNGGWEHPADHDDHTPHGSYQL
ncbi:hypothetical protein PRK78_005733 [Emydomyces testavorans]|uniref:Uncharacterized protein n=1 Tax=Emydomyces testavorans TaxID=2070801 RepID=A0AAF0DL98_9EURO|nr:hypothetical protein PRK78_005733 [Emydomyces testavorans]